MNKSLKVIKVQSLVEILFKEEKQRLDLLTGKDICYVQFYRHVISILLGRHLFKNNNDLYILTKDIQYVLEAAPICWNKRQTIEEDTSINLLKRGCELILFIFNLQ